MHAQMRVAHRLVQGHARELDVHAEEYAAALPKTHGPGSIQDTQ